MRKHGIIFDCDGTLVDSISQALESFNYGLTMVGERKRSAEQIKQHFGAGADRILTALIGDERKGSIAFDHYLEHQSQLADKTLLHAGVRELLDQLKFEGIPMAVVTGRHARDLEVVLAPHDLSEYFVTLIADNHAPNSKPAPDGVLLAAERMGLDPSSTFYVGDAIYDIQAARAAGSVAVAALWDPLADPAALRAEMPEFMAQTPVDVWRSFQRKFPL